MLPSNYFSPDCFLLLLILLIVLLGIRVIVISQGSPNRERQQSDYIFVDTKGKLSNEDIEEIKDFIAGLKSGRITTTKLEDKGFEDGKKG